MHLPDVFERSQAYLRKRPLLEYSWKEIVQQYSRGSLTRSRDKIVAISGLSRAAQDTQRFGYLAGLWRSSLIFRLCWHRTSDIAPPPVEYRGPNWSWVSVDSGVTLVSGPWDSDTTNSTTLYAQVIVWWGSLGHFGETVFPPSVGLTHLSVFKLLPSHGGEGININQHTLQLRITCTLCDYCLLLLLW
jgi:hypothetical protein